MPDIVHSSTLPFKALGFKHRTGEPSFKFLFTGPSATSSNNYLFALASQKHFFSPVHKHNFEQFRYAYRGSFSIGSHLTIEQGEVAYHPEGVEYGPQNDEEDGTEHWLVILQFGGVSGQGFLGYQELLSVQKELGESGRFEKGKYFANGAADGKGVDGFQACWEKVHGRNLVYPEPKYAGPVLLKVENFEWREEGKGVKRKTLGSFTERGTRVEKLWVGDGGKLELKEEALQLLFVCEGSGEIGSERLETEDAVRLVPGESAIISSNSAVEILRLVIPPLDE